MARILDWFRRPLPDDEPWAGEWEPSYEPGEEEQYWVQDIAAYNEEHLYGETRAVRGRRRRRVWLGVVALWGIFLFYGALTTPRVDGRPVILTIPVRSDRTYLGRFDQAFVATTTTAAANLALIQAVSAGHETSYAAGATLTQALTRTNALLQQEQPIRPPTNYVVLQTELVNLLSAQAGLLQAEITAVSTPGSSVTGQTVSTDWKTYQADWTALNGQLTDANAQVALTWHAPAL